MENNNQEQEHAAPSYTAKEVDKQNSESYIDGYAHGFNVFMEACEKSLRSIDDVMGFYMEDDLRKFDDRVNELHLAHNAIRFAMSKMDDAYDEQMRQLKNLWNLDGYIANND